MKTILRIGLALLLPMSGWAQTTGTPAYREGHAVIDTSGNLLVFDQGRSSTGVTVTGLRHTFYAPVTRVTVQHPGSSNNIQTVSYDAEVQVIGMGTSALFAIATVYTVSSGALSASSSLIAIKGGQTLPAALSGFPTLALTSGVNASVGPSDYISLITDSNSTSRTATVVHFNGSSFDIVSSGTLP